MITNKFIEIYSAAYDEANHQENELEQRIRDSIREQKKQGRSYLTKSILRDILRWKAARVGKLIKDNEDDFVEAVTKLAFAAKNERLRVEALTLIKGVGYRVATAVLHFWCPERYTVMDWRVWGTLQKQGYLDEEIRNDFTHWQDYLRVCRQIADKNQVSLRKLDKACWQYSKEKK